eukprot:5681182-Amphidinium_carterae.1
MMLKRQCQTVLKVSRGPGHCSQTERRNCRHHAVVTRGPSYIFPWIQSLGFQMVPHHATCELAIELALGTGLEKFMSDFRRSPQYNGSGRGALDRHGGALGSDGAAADAEVVSGDRHPRGAASGEPAPPDTVGLPGVAAVTGWRRPENRRLDACGRSSGDASASLTSESVLVPGKNTFLIPGDMRSWIHGWDEDVQSTTESRIADMNPIVTCRPTDKKDISQAEVASKLNALVKNIMSSRDSLLPHLSEGDKTYLSTPWYWGYSATAVSAGLEFAFVGSIKYQHTGSRFIVAAPFGSVQEFLAARSIPSSTVQSVVDAFSEVSLKGWES